MVKRFKGNIKAGGGVCFLTSPPAFSELFDIFAGGAALELAEYIVEAADALEAALHGGNGDGKLTAAQQLGRAIHSVLIHERAKIDVIAAVKQPGKVVIFVSEMLRRVPERDVFGEMPGHITEQIADEKVVSAAAFLEFGGLEKTVADSIKAGFFHHDRALAENQSGAEERSAERVGIKAKGEASALQVGNV